MVFAIRPSMNQRAITFFGVFASILISVGLFPQYWEIFKRREVVGISIPFMIIDILGGLFSDLSLVFRKEFDVIAAVAYTLVIVRVSYKTHSSIATYGSDRSWMVLSSLRL